MVLTDGDTFEDPLNLTAVINSPKMRGIERFAIGVRAWCWGPPPDPAQSGVGDRGPENSVLLPASGVPTSHPFPNGSHSSLAEQ